MPHYNMFVVVRVLSRDATTLHRCLGEEKPQGACLHMSNLSQAGQHYYRTNTFIITHDINNAGQRMQFSEVEKVDWTRVEEGKKGEWGAGEREQTGGLPPRGVPVPCICTIAISAPATPPSCRACLMTPCWEGPLGAVRLLLLPSWFTALPDSSTKPGSMLAGTAAAGTRIAAPTASART